MNFFITSGPEVFESWTLTAELETKNTGLRDKILPNVIEHTMTI